MKKFEYMSVNIRELMTQKRSDKNIIPSVSDGVVYDLVINQLGSEGWELTPTGDASFFAKREKK